MSLKELKTAIKEKKLKLGTEETLKETRKGTPKEVFVSSNCPEEIKKQIKQYCKISKISITELKETNEELGVICKKPFSINMCYY